MALSSLLQNLSIMHSEKLHSSVEILSSYLMTMMKNSSDSFTAANQYETLIYHAESKFDIRQYQKAEFVYRQALQIRKDAIKQTNKASVSSTFSKLPTDTEVKYKIHLCCNALGDNDNAISILESIPVKIRSAKVHYSLAKIYHKLGMDRPAITSYKEVLKKCPLALDVIFCLISLGESPTDFISLISTATQGAEWLITLIKAHSLMQNREFQKSFSSFELLNKKFTVSGNVQLLCSLANVRARTGNKKSAIQFYESARMADPFLLDGMDKYAYILYDENEHVKLDAVANRLFTISELHPAPWIALGYRAMYKKDYERVIYLTVQATKINPLCVQAILLKGTALRSMNEIKDALAHFREALRIDPHWFPSYTELVGTYLPQNRANEALAVAHSALKTIGFRPNCLVLIATVHMWDLDSKDKALNYVDKALSLDPNNRYAIAVKASILFKRKKFTEAIKFLENRIKSFSSSPIHTALANCYLEVKSFPKAVDHYRIALSLNPSNKEAEEGMNKVIAIQQETTFEDDDGGGDAMQNATSGDDGNSDSDTMWSDSLFGT